MNTDDRDTPLSGNRFPGDDIVKGQVPRMGDPPPVPPERGDAPPPQPSIVPSIPDTAQVPRMTDPPPPPTEKM